MATTPEEYQEKVQQFSLKGENHPMWGKTHTEEAKKKIGKASSERNSGESNPLYGKKHSEASLDKMRKNRKGKGTGPRSAETRKRMSESVPEHTCHIAVKPLEVHPCSDGTSIIANTRNNE